MATTTTTTTTTTRTEKIHVLYGSQTGNSEEAARDWCEAASTELSPTRIRRLAGVASDEVIRVRPVHMQLDDFLELERCAWTRVTVIFTSSYGVGQAPLGCHRFRELCDAWMEEQEDNKNDDEGKRKVLTGCYYAMCGLGDSKYTTFFRNPTRIDDALTAAGATRVGPLGRCDASDRDVEQSERVANWTAESWRHVADVVARSPAEASVSALRDAQEATANLCRRINPDFSSPDDENRSSHAMAYQVVLPAVLGVLLAVVVALYWKQ